MLDRDDYALTQKVLHWLIVVLVIGMIVGGNVMTDLGWPDPETAKTTNFLYLMHKSTGLLILALMVLRLAARIVHGAPLQDPTMPGIQRFVAGATHFLLYGLLFAMPLVGWIATSAGGYMEPFYGAVPIPALTPETICGVVGSVPQALGLDVCTSFIGQPGKVQAETLFGLHEILAKALVATAVLHALGAFYHLFVRQDGVFSRMWFRRPEPQKLK